MELKILGLLAGMTIFYLIRYFAEESYRKRGIKGLLFDILVTTLLGSGVIWIVELIRN
ncbi:hypothetical protein ACFFJY_14555 [Fictibacillus aquaticus]|uniref:hypothetical protein n=1 Tax=Fictibacillus aquaticus TaxID=2021314 RepID=UPI0013FD2192|nr:hypothetical protein [Fictibacillus aquaticus]